MWCTARDFCYMISRPYFSLNELLRDKKLSKLAKRAVQIILDAFDKRFKVNNNMILASFLDPSMQHLQIIKDHFNDRDVDVADALYEKWSNYELTAAGEVVSLNQKQSDKKVVSKTAGSDVKRIRLELIEKHCSVSAVSDSPLVCIRAELHKYSSVVGVIEDPLEWWRKNQIQFPYLSQIARVMLSFTATSAIVERFFSKAGVLVTKRKANLDPMNIQKILFVHENYKLINNFYDP